MRTNYDVLVIGGGIAGTSIGYHLAVDRSVGLLEMENVLGYHTTGRSAAAFLESYGSRTVRLLVSASREFYENPPEGFEGPLLFPRSLLWVACDSDVEVLDALEIGVREFVQDAERIDGKRAVELCPVLSSSWVSQALVEPGASDIDVHAVHQGYIRGLRERGGVIHNTAKVGEIRRNSGMWQVVTGNGDSYESPIVVNAAGAWGDEIGRLAGAQPVGLRPMLRNVFIVAKPKVPEDCDFAHLPLVHDVAPNFYFKPEGDSLLCSPADEIPSEPCDAKPDVESIALAIDRINEATTMDIRHVKSSWAGLRTFLADRTPIACFDPEIEGFFWLVGQGGYGIETSPALSRAAARILTDSSLPVDIAARGLDVADLHCSRLRGVTELASH